MRRWWTEPGLLGWVAVPVVVLVADVAAVRSGRATMSRYAAVAQRHPVMGPVTVGVTAGTVWHLFVDPVLRSLVRDETG